MIMIDIDDFKYLNDKHGHLYGDRILKGLASILSEAMPPGGRVYRFGGDEFMCIVPSDRVVSVCGAIRDNVRKEDCFTVSQGAVMQISRELTNDVITIADKAMYRSKKLGRGGITMMTARLAPAC
jgi:diguanylate cyclase (GGDEF)-like protein